MLEVDRPDRSTRRRRGKSDPIDAEAAARTVLTETALGTGLAIGALVDRAARFRPRVLTTPCAATKLAMRELARRWLTLTAEICRLDTELDRLVAQTAPDLTSLLGVGTDVAGALLVAAGDNPQRLRSEASFARLCGVAPLEASSGKTVRRKAGRPLKPSAD